MKNLTTAIAITLGCAALAGCDTTQINEMSFAQLRVVASKIERTCAPYKKQRSTYNLCLDQEVNREVATRINNRRQAREFAAAASQAMQNMSDNYARQAQAYAANNVSCSTYYSGNYATTNCY